VPVPRRFDRRPPERDSTRINDRIRVPEVRLIDDEGNQVGVMKTAEALAFAQERELDLVEVAPEARPPVARVLDYSKYKYEQAQKQKQARKHQQQITVREIKFRPKIAQHDYDTKKQHVERFLRHKDKVKITIMFRGREVTHPERGTAILDRLAEELAELGVVEQHPTQEGRNMTMLMAPSKAVLAGRTDGAGESAAAAEAARSPDAAAAAANAPTTDAAATTNDAAAPDTARTGAANASADATPPSAASDASAEPTDAAEIANGAGPAELGASAEPQPASEDQTPAAQRPEAAITASPPGGAAQADAKRVA
jgi:translation initiation factor IF-3